MPTQSASTLARRAAALAALCLLGACGERTPTGPAAKAPDAAPARAMAGYGTKDVVPWLSGGYRYSIGAFGHAPGFEAPGFDDSSWPTGTGGFGFATFCEVAGRIRTSWPGSSDILLRRSFTLPAGAVNVRVEAMVDNDVQAWVNGVEVSPGGLLTHEGCAEEHLLTAWAVPASALSASGTNVLAVRARDRGAVAFIDARVFADVPLDATPPVVTPVVAGTPGDNGWYTSNVTVSWLVQDPDGPFVSGSGCRTVSLVGTDTPGRTFQCTAVSEGGTTVVRHTVRRDATAPSVAFAGNVGSYLLTETVAITCSASDALSGLASSTCADVSAPAYTFGAGTHTLEAAAVDNAGNTSTAGTSFQVVATYDGVCTLVRQFVTQHGVANSLCVKLANAQRAAARGDEAARSGLLGAFVNEVNAQSGRFVPADRAAILVALAGAL